MVSPNFELGRDAECTMQWALSDISKYHQLGVVYNLYLEVKYGTLYQGT